MKISILTLFPQMFQGPFDYSIIKRAKENKLIEISLIDIRDFGIGKHKTVDDKPYGGGIGMIIKVDVLKKAIEHAVDKNLKDNEQKIILLSASGKTYNQNMAKNFSKLKHLILICGHYEGVDERIKKYIDLEISVGDFVLTGGEIPAMIIADSAVRLIDGVLKKDATENESFSKKMKLEHPQYTRPTEFEGLTVPKILISGDHQKIQDWKNRESLKKTLRKI
jgi:tRNA (guanine37-N1)-methyltransferase